MPDVPPPAPRGVQALLLKLKQNPPENIAAPGAPAQWVGAVSLPSDPSWVLFGMIHAFDSAACKVQWRWQKQVPGDGEIGRALPLEDDMESIEVDSACRAAREVQRARNEFLATCHGAERVVAATLCFQVTDWLHAGAPMAGVSLFADPEPDPLIVISPSRFDAWRRRALALCENLELVDPKITKVLAELKREQSAEATPDSARLNARELAKVFGLNGKEFLRLKKRLDRWRPKAADGDVTEDTSARSGEARYIYRVGAVRHILDVLHRPRNVPAK